MAQETITTESNTVTPDGDVVPAYDGVNSPSYPSPYLHTIPDVIRGDHVINTKLVRVATQDVAPTSEEPAVTHTAKPTSGLVELPGKNGRNNWYNRSLSTTEARRGMSRAEIAAQSQTNRMGATAAKTVLATKKPIKP